MSVVKRIFGIKVGTFQQYPPRPLTYQIESSFTCNSERLPSISIVTPSYNQGAFIEQTIDSVLSQNYPFLEYIIQDACSTDCTLDVLNKFPPKAFECIVEHDGGQADAINRGFLRSKGEIMCWLNSDDLLSPRTLCLVGEYFQNNSEIDVVYGNRIVIDSDGNEIGRWILPEHDSNVLRVIDYVPQETLFWRRRIWDKVGGKLDDELKFALDWDLLLKFCKANAKFSHLPMLFCAFRVHNKQKTSLLIQSIGRNEMRQLRAKYAGSISQRLIDLIRYAIFLIRHKICDYRFRQEHIKNKLYLRRF